MHELEIEAEGLSREVKFIISMCLFDLMRALE